MFIATIYFAIIFAESLEATRHPRLKESAENAKTLRLRLRRN